MVQATTIIPHLSREAEDLLEGLIDKFGLQNVLNGLACICSGKADHIESKIGKTNDLLPIGKRPPFTS